MPPCHKAGSLSNSPRCAQFKSRGGGKGFPVSYPCVVLNVMVAKHNTNEQYAELVDGGRKDLRHLQPHVYRVRGGRALPGEGGAHGCMCRA